MTKGDRITIEAVANGWIVRPDVDRDRVTFSHDMLVFQRMGDKLDESTLLGFIAKHFFREELQ